MYFLPDSDSEDELPPGWKVRATDEGIVRYVNQQAKTTQWTHPRTGHTKRISNELPIDWEHNYDKDTQQFVFRSKQTNQTTNVDPKLAFAIEEPPLNVTQVRQRFDSCSTALQVLHGKDLHGRLALITGANFGIGYEMARSLLQHGYEVIFACRSRESTEKAIECLAEERPTLRARCR